LNTKSLIYFNYLNINCSVLNNLSLNRIHHIDDYFVECKNVYFVLVILNIELQRSNWCSIFKGVRYLFIISRDNSAGDCIVCACYYCQKEQLHKTSKLSAKCTPVWIYWKETIYCWSKWKTGFFGSLVDIVL
jgi:hypothetical protein